MTPRASSLLSAVSRATSTPTLVRLEAAPWEQPEQSPRQVVVEETNVEEGVAFGAPEQVEEPHREAEREESEEEEEEEELQERSRSEPPKTRLRPPRVAPTDRPLVLRPRVHGYPTSRVDQQLGTWALIAPAGGVVTPLAGPKHSRIASPSSGDVERFTEETWQAGPDTELYHFGEDSNSDSHRSTSSDPPSMPPKAPKRTSSQAYSHSPPPLPQQLPQSRFHQPKSEQQVLDQPLSGTIEAPIVEEPARSTRIRRPEPPPPKRSRIEFGSRQLPVHPAIILQLDKFPSHHHQRGHTWD